jgi:hypothetical protein
MTSRELEEYRALRDTIRERSTARVWIAYTGLTAWAALALATATLVELPIATLIPLLVVSLVFEVVFALHTVVERVGRYIQVFFEDEAADRGWEHQAMAYGREFPGRGTDPLFGGYFLLAMILNMLPAALARPVPLEWAVVAGGHLVAVGRLVVARRDAARQRPLDLERFRQLKRAGQRP